MQYAVEVRSRQIARAFVAIAVAGDLVAGIANPRDAMWMRAAKLGDDVEGDPQPERVQQREQAFRTLIGERGSGLAREMPLEITEKAAGRLGRGGQTVQPRPDKGRKASSAFFNPVRNDAQTEAPSSHRAAALSGAMISIVSEL